jgi:type VI secretion system protein VasG
MPLSEESIRRVINLKLAKLSEKVFSKHSVVLNFADELQENICQKILTSKTGIRCLDAILAQDVIPRIAQAVFEKNDSQDEGHKIATVV